MPKISVIIPTHCRPEFLPRAVASAKDAGADIEIIVVDDASTDLTAEVCKELVGIKYVRLERNQGVAGARNIGLLESSGKYIAFLDDDDLRLSGSLDRQAQALDDNAEVGFICGAMIMADQNYQPTGELIAPNSKGGDVFWDLLELNFPVMGLSALIRKDCFLRAGLLKRHLNGVEDWDMFVRIAELFPVLVDKQPVGVYRKPTVRSGQGSSAQATQLWRASKVQLELFKLQRVVNLPRAHRRALRQHLRRRIADTLLCAAAQLLARREFGPASANILVALWLSPMRVIRPKAYPKLLAALTSKRT